MIPVRPSKTRCATCMATANCYHQPHSQLGKHLLSTELIEINELRQKLIRLSDWVARLALQGLSRPRRALIDVHRSGSSAGERDLERSASLFKHSSSVFPLVGFWRSPNIGHQNDARKKDVDVSGTETHQAWIGHRLCRREPGTRAIIWSAGALGDIIFHQSVRHGNSAYNPVTCK